MSKSSKYVEQEGESDNCLRHSTGPQRTRKESKRNKGQEKN